MNENVLKDHFFLCRDAQYPKINGFNLFMHFYQNRTENILVYNPWNRNMEKLIFLEVFVDVDLLKALIKSYNLATRTFQKHNGSILCTLDLTSFIEAFGLEGHMDVPIDIEDL